MLRHLIIFCVAAPFVYLFAQEIAGEIQDEKNKVLCTARAYLACVVFVFAGSAFFAGIGSAGVEVGDTDEYQSEVATDATPPKSAQEEKRITEEIFLITILPAFFGVRSAIYPSHRRPLQIVRNRFRKAALPPSV